MTSAPLVGLQPRLDQPHGLGNRLLDAEIAGVEPLGVRRLHQRRGGARRVALVDKLASR